MPPRSSVRSSPGVRSSPRTRAGLATPRTTPGRRPRTPDTRPRAEQARRSAERLARAARAVADAAAADESSSSSDDDDEDNVDYLSRTEAWNEQAKNSALGDNPLMALVALRQEPGISDRRIALLDKIIRNARPGSGRTVEGYKNLPITVVRRRRDREIITNAPKKYHTEVMYTGEVMSNYNEKAYLDNKAARGILGNIEWGVNYYEPSRWQEGWTYPDEDIAMSSGQLVIRPSELSNDRLMHPRFARLAFCITFPWMNSFTYTRLGELHVRLDSPSATCTFVRYGLRDHQDNGILITQAERDSCEELFDRLEAACNAYAAAMQTVRGELDGFDFQDWKNIAVRCRYWPNPRLVRASRAAEDGDGPAAEDDDPEPER